MYVKEYYPPPVLDKEPKPPLQRTAYKLYTLVGRGRFSCSRQLALDECSRTVYDFKLERRFSSSRGLGAIGRLGRRTGRSEEMTIPARPVPGRSRTAVASGQWPPVKMRRRWFSKNDVRRFSLENSAVGRRPACATQPRKKAPEGGDGGGPPPMGAPEKRGPRARRPTVRGAATNSERTPLPPAGHGPINPPLSLASSP